MNQKISCAEVLSKFYDYLDNEVDDLTDADIERHLHSCRECFNRAEFEKTLKHRVAQSGSVSTPEDVRQRLKSLIKRF